MEVIMFEVGKKLPLSCGTGINILWDINGFTLVVKEMQLSPLEIKSFRSGKMEIGLVYINKVIFFILNIDNFLCNSDIAFNARISPVKKEEIPIIEKGKGFAFNMILVEGMNNTIKAMRVASLNQDMSEKLRECMLDQFKDSFNPDIYARVVSDLQDRYSSDALAKMTIASTKYKK